MIASGWIVVSTWGLLVETLNCVFGKRVDEVGQHVLLPSGVQVLVDLIDQHDCLRFERVVEVWVALCHSSGEVCCQCEDDAGSTAHLVYVESFGGT